MTTAFVVKGADDAVLPIICGFNAKGKPLISNLNAIWA
jgi:hypothetical protein